MVVEADDHQGRHETRVLTSQTHDPDSGSRSHDNSTSNFNSCLKSCWVHPRSPALLILLNLSDWPAAVGGASVARGDSCNKDLKLNRVSTCVVG